MTTSTSADSASLNSLWGQWTVIVDLFARKQIARRHVKAEDYRALHARLLEACSHSAEAKVEKFARRAADLVRPWMSIESLDSAPAKILGDLLQSCRSVEQESRGCGPSGASHWPLSAAVFVMLFVVVFFGTLIALNASGDSVRTTSVLGRLSEFGEMPKAFLKANEEQLGFWGMGALGGVVVAGMAFCVFRSPRQT